MINFGEFTPDQPALGSNGTDEARNVIPAARSYRPFKGLEDVSSGVLGDYCRGLVWGQGNAGSTFAFAGEGTKLQQLSASGLSDASKAGGYSTPDKGRWSMVAYGSQIIASNYANPIQSFTIGSSSKFADLSEEAPKAKYLAIVNNFLVACATDDATNGQVDYMVQWSALANPAEWTPDLTSMAGFQPLQNGGRIQGVTGGEYGVILMERSLYRMDFVGVPYIMTFNEIEQGKGCMEPGSVIRSTRGTYYLASDGFHLFDGQRSHAIGEQRINEWFFKRFDQQHSHRMSAAVDLERKIVLFSYPTIGSGGEPSEVLIYHEELNRWSYASFDHEIIGGLATAGYTLEDLDALGNLDSINISVDARQWKGGNPFLGAVRSRRVASFTGPNLEAEVSTGEQQLGRGTVSMVQEVWPLVEGAASNIQARIGSRMRQNDPVVWSGTIMQTASGHCPSRSTGRFHRAKIVVPAGEDWESLIGINFKAARRGRR